VPWCGGLGNVSKDAIVRCRNRGIDNFVSTNSVMKSMFVLLLVGMLSASGFAQDEQSKKAECDLASVLVADGQAKEWPMEWITDADDPKFSYNICSDNSNLYVRVKLKDELVRRKMALFGFTMWLDPNGKKKRKVGLKFPTGSEGSERMELIKQAGERTMSSGERADFQKEVNRYFIKDLEILELIGLADNPLTSTRSGITNGIKVGLGIDEEESYIYEAQVPFKSFRLSKAAIENLGVGFETGKYVPKAQKNADATSRSNQSRNSGPMGIPTSYWVVVKMK